jgi:hypothetical protein
MQFVFDNADHDQGTLTGHGTFHSIGGNMCVAPMKAVGPSSRFSRVTEYFIATSLREQGNVEMSLYKKAVSHGL